jgi:FKBP-type peptidyl-prolyl cis-trans isomerase FkpA
MPSGLEYRVFPCSSTGGSSGIVAASGSMVKLRLRVWHADTLVHGGGGSRLPLYQPLIPGLVYPYSPMEALFGRRAGDSVVVEQRVDSMLRKGLLRSLPAGWKSSDRLWVRMLVLAVFPFDNGGSDSAVRADKAREAKLLLDREQAAGVQRVRGWLEKRKIVAMPGPSGVFLEVVAGGTGDIVDSGSALVIRYTCSDLGGRVLDSNTDTAFHHPPVLAVLLGSGQLPPAIDRALRGLRMGSRVRVYMSAAASMTVGVVLQQGGIVGEDRVWELTF